MNNMYQELEVICAHIYFHFHFLEELLSSGDKIKAYRG